MSYSNGSVGNYENMCDKVKVSDKELCNFLRSRVVEVKEKCVFPYDIKDVKFK